MSTHTTRPRRARGLADGTWSWTAIVGGFTAYVLTGLGYVIGALPIGAWLASIFVSAVLATAAIELDRCRARARHQWAREFVADLRGTR